MVPIRYIALVPLWLSLAVSIQVPQKKRDLLPNKQICGTQHVDDPLFSSSVPMIDEFPWLVYLPVQSRTPSSDLNLRCAGVLISKRYVLTSNRCLNWALTNVHLGVYDWTKNVSCLEIPGTSDCTDPIVELEIEKRVQTEDHDLLMLRLNKDVTFTEFIKPICLPLEEGEKPGPGDGVQSSGWGLYTDSDASYATVKKRVKHNVISNEDCQAKKPSVKATNPNLLCTVPDSTVEGFVCHGDQGGPLMYFKGQWYLAGVIEMTFEGYTPCIKKGPMEAARVNDKILQWIVDNIEA